MLVLHHQFHRNKSPKTKHNHNSAQIRLLDNLVTVVAVITPAMALSQVAKVWIDHSAGGISILSWTALAIQSGFWVTYGVAHRAKPIIISNICWVIINTLVALGAAIYQ